MQVRTLHKQLGELIAKGYGHNDVVINKDTFRHPLEPDGCVLLPVIRAEAGYFRVLDGDGGTKYNKDGSERMRSGVILLGEHAPLES
jgi:hypothetical protein